MVADLGWFPGYRLEDSRLMDESKINSLLRKPQNILKNNKYYESHRGSTFASINFTAL